jgi:hypothetical protein
MDPSANLKEQVEEAQGILETIENAEGDGIDEMDRDDLIDAVNRAYRLAELVLEMHEWRRQGGRS